MSEQNTHTNNNVGAVRELPNDSFSIDRTREKVYILVNRATEPLLYSMLKWGGFFYFWDIHAI